MSNARFRGDFRACDGNPEDNPCYAVERIKEFLPAPRLNSLRSNSSNYLTERAMAENDTSWFQEDNSWPKTPRHGKRESRLCTNQDAPCDLSSVMPCEDFAKKASKRKRAMPVSRTFKIEKSFKLLKVSDMNVQLLFLL